MTAINRPIDVLLNTETQVSTPPKSQDSTLTDYNQRKSSFDDVLSAQRRETSRETEQRPEKPEVETKKPDESREGDERQALAATEKGGKEKVEDGKALPPEEQENAVAKAVDDEASNEDFQLTTQVVTDELLVDEQSDEQAENTELAVTGQEAQPVLPFAQELTAKIEAAKQAVATPRATTEAARAAPIAGTLTSVEQQKQAQQQTAPVFSGLAEQTAVGVKAAGSDGLVSGAQLTGELKLEGSNQNQGRQLPFGLELKQWLSEAKTATDAKSAAAASATSSVTSESNTTAPARLNGLTQAIQGLSGQKPTSMSFNVPAPVNTANWGQVVAQRIAWLAGNGIRAAELQLNPQELGPVDVKISVNNDQASIQFASHQSSVREALELSVHRLRDMLESQGLDLVDVNVSDQSASEQSGESGDSSGLASSENAELDQEPEAVLTSVVESNSLVDYYA